MQLGRGAHLGPPRGVHSLGRSTRRLKWAQALYFRHSCLYLVRSGVYDRHQGGWLRIHGNLFLPYGGRMSRVQVQAEALPQEGVLVPRRSSGCVSGGRGNGGALWDLRYRL